MLDDLRQQASSTFDDDDDTFRPTATASRPLSRDDAFSDFHHRHASADDDLPAQRGLFAGNRACGTAVYFLASSPLSDSGVPGSA